MLILSCGLQTTSNSARGAAAYVWTVYGGVTVAGCVFSRNTAIIKSVGYGAGMCVSNATLVVSNSSFVGNRILSTNTESYTSNIGVGAGLWYEGLLLRLTGVLLGSNVIRRATSAMTEYPSASGSGKPPPCIRELDLSLLSGVVRVAIMLSSDALPSTSCMRRAVCERPGAAGPLGDCPEQFGGGEERTWHWDVCGGL